MNRRTFLGSFVGGLLTAPRALQAQPAGRLYRVGFLGGPGQPLLFEAFRRGLHELGWIEGRTLVFERPSTEGMAEHVPDLLAELVRNKADVIVIDAHTLAHAGHLTTNVPMVFVIADDPVAAGYVASLARPAGRMTGLTSLNLGLDVKRLEILKMASPSVTRVGVLSAPEDRTHRERLVAIEQGARALGLHLVILDVPSDDKLSQAFSAASRARIGAIMELGQPVLFRLQRELVGLSDKARVPVISAWREFPEAGGLMSYGTRVSEMFRRAASYVDRILKGSDPADLPVEQASKFELVINLKTAKALGLTIPPSLLLRTDEVIQ